MRRFVLPLTAAAFLAMQAAAPPSAEARFYYSPGFYRYDPTSGNHVYVTRYPVPYRTPYVYTGRYLSSVPRAAPVGFYGPGAFPVPVYSPVARNPWSRRVTVGPLWFPGYGVAAP